APVSPARGSCSWATSLAVARPRLPQLPLEGAHFAAQFRDRLVPVVDRGAGRVAEDVAVERRELLLRKAQIGAGLEDLPLRFEEPVRTLRLEHRLVGRFDPQRQDLA